MLIGNTKTFGIDVEVQGNNTSNFLIEDQVTSAKLTIYVDGHKITENGTNSNVLTSCFSLASWMSCNYNDIFELKQLPIKIKCIDSEDLISQYNQLTQSDDRSQANKISQWLDSRTINRYEDSLLPQLTFIYYGNNSIDLVWLPCKIKDIEYLAKGQFRASIIDIKNVFRYFVIATSIMLKNANYNQASKQILRRWIER